MGKIGIPSTTAAASHPPVSPSCSRPSMNVVSTTKPASARWINLAVASDPSASTATYSISICSGPLACQISGSGIKRPASRNSRGACR